MRGFDVRNCDKSIVWGGGLWFLKKGFTLAASTRQGFSDKLRNLYPFWGWNHTQTILENCHGGDSGIPNFILTTGRDIWNLDILQLSDWPVGLWHYKTAVCCYSWLSVHILIYHVDGSEKPGYLKCGRWDLAVVFQKHCRRKIDASRRKNHADGLYWQPGIPWLGIRASGGNNFTLALSYVAVLNWVSGPKGLLCYLVYSYSHTMEPKWCLWFVVYSCSRTGDPRWRPWYIAAAIQHIQNGVWIQVGYRRQLSDDKNLIDGCFFPLPYPYYPLQVHKTTQSCVAHIT